MKITIQISLLMFVLVLLSRYSFSSYLRENFDFLRGDIAFKGNFIDNTFFYKSMAFSELVLSLTILLVGLVLVVPTFCWIINLIVKFVHCVVEKTEQTFKCDNKHQKQFVCTDVYLKQEKFLC